MKLQTIASTSLLSLIAALSISVQAADTKDTTTAAETKTQVQTQAQVPVQQGTQTSMPQNTASAPAVKKHAAQDRSKHYHPRDGK